MRQFRSQSTARGRVAHLTAFFSRAARAAALTTHQIRQYQLARRAALVHSCPALSQNDLLATRPGYGRRHTIR